MRMMFVYLPVVILILGFMFHRIRIGRTAIFFVAWMAIAVYAAAHSFPSFEHGSDPVMPMLWFMIAMTMTCTGILVATVFGILTSPKLDPTPIKVAAEAATKTARAGYEVYQGLDPATKSKIRAGVRMGGKFAARGASQWLRERGWRNSASALRGASKLF